VGPKTEYFTKILAYECLHECIPCVIFTTSPFVGSFMLGHILKFGQIHSRGFRVMGFKFRDCILPQIFSAP